ncbi:hypothetical protein HPB49_015826 [Dermacentor silvarum]|uniref:Uncharacterized protein n=1 Tax=Dermacentor silvarum TaxID=543639 RepID=A0ACB8DJJ7_DERSI|nr:hypothetical protein HPB49_015826 [Dermacentor silvarum]
MARRLRRERTATDSVRVNQQRNVKQQVIRNSKMPLLLRSDFKIVIRPRGGLDVATTGTVRLASAIYRAANVPAQEAGEDTVCSNNRQNIIVLRRQVPLEIQDPQPRPLPVPEPHPGPPEGTPDAQPHPQKDRNEGHRDHREGMRVKVAEKLGDLTQVARNVRSVKERSGTEKEYEAVDRLLQQVADLAREWGYRQPRSAVRSHRVEKGGPACAAARVARPKNRMPGICRTATLKVLANALKEGDNDFGDNRDVLTPAALLHRMCSNEAAEQEPADEPDDPGQVVLNRMS